MHDVCLSYDLSNKTSSQYSKIYHELRKYDSTRLQQSIWLLRTTKSIDEIMNDFRHCVDQNDRLAVFPIDQNLLNILKE